jgi:hypothetical protein
MKHLLSVWAFVLVMVFGCTVAEAFNISWLGDSRDYSNGEIVAGWKILDYKDAGPGGLDWSTIGSNYPFGGVRYPDVGPSSSVRWICYSNDGAATTFRVKSTAVAFMLENDTNDGYADIYVDDKLIYGNYKMMNLIKARTDQEGNPYWTGTLVISGLSDDYHTLKIIGTPGYNGRHDTHVYGGAAVQSVPVPAAAWLLGSGLLGLAGLRRRFSK